MDLSFIFIGSTHYFLDDFSKQKELIDSINPEFVLSEELGNLKLDAESKFKEILKKKFISDMTSFNEVEKLIKLCFEKKIKLIGIDFHNFGFDKNLQNKIKNQKKLTNKEEEILEELTKKREKIIFQKFCNINQKQNFQ